jgi:hypothetical protein
LKSRKPTGPDARAYTKWHWGTKPSRVVNWRDPDFPARLLGIGQLAELHVHRPRARQPDVVTIRPQRYAHNHVAFDPTHRHQRIYLCLAAPERRGARRRFWNPRQRPIPLAQASRLSKGHHVAADYPKVMVQPIGVLTDLTYRTRKKPDAKEDGGKLGLYIHAMGEDGGVPPILCVDATGRLWLAGGTYDAPVEGIRR